MKIEEIRFPTARGEGISRRIVEASFEEWLTYIFDRPECEYGEHWSFGDVGPDWKVPAALSSEFISRTYEEPQRWISRFSPGQIAAGLEFTWNTSASGVSFTILHESVPWPLRQRAIQALVSLYEQCFRKLCSPGLGHLSECVDNPVNSACYMYWDVCPYYGQPEKPEHRAMDDECLRVMEKTLRIDHDACRESALHGLGHWALGYPSRASSIIEQELKAVRKNLRPELWEYAQAAKLGNVQ